MHIFFQFYFVYYPHQFLLEPKQIPSGTQTNTLKPSAQVSNSCLVNSTDNLSFGSYIPSSGAALQASGQIKLTCTKGATATIVPISGGASMAGVGGALNYGMYVDSALTKPWKNGTFTTYANLNMATGTTIYFQNAFPISDGTSCGSYINGSIPKAYIQTATTRTCMYGISSQPTANAFQIGGLNSSNANSAQFKAPSNPNFIVAWLNIATDGNPPVGTTYNVLTNIGTGNPLTATATSVSTPIALTYYGQVPAKQDIQPGTYTDTVTVQVSF